MRKCFADFKQVLGQRGSKGPAPPAKLTAHQTQIVRALIDAHQDDLEVNADAFVHLRSGSQGAHSCTDTLQLPGLPVQLTCSQ